MRKPFVVIGAVGLVKGRIKPDPGSAMIAVTKTINPHLWACNWLENAPFKLVNFILRLGNTRSETEIAPIIQRHSELPVARELSMSECEQRAPKGTLFDYFYDETITAMADVSRKYQLPLDWMDAIRSERDG